MSPVPARGARGRAPRSLLRDFVAAPGTGCCAPGRLEPEAIPQRMVLLFHPRMGCRQHPALPACACPSSRVRRGLLCRAHAARCCFPSRRSLPALNGPFLRPPQGWLHPARCGQGQDTAVPIPLLVCGRPPRSRPQRRPWCQRRTLVTRSANSGRVGLGPRGPGQGPALASSMPRDAPPTPAESPQGAPWLHTRLGTCCAAVAAAKRE